MKTLFELQLIEFLQQELSISAAEIGLVTRHQETPLSQLPIMLWQYGLITLQQLEKIFDWQDQVRLNGGEI
jgi:Protein of unknown function (DUF2949)